MEEQLISFETAKLTKEKGFIELCNAYFYLKKNSEQFYSNAINVDLKNYNENLRFISQPTQSLLQRWLREKYNIHINITKVYECSKTPAIFDGWNIYIAGKDFETNYNVNSSLISKYFETYEEALEYGLQEALKLV